jgi:hypothetical protein
MYLGIYDKAKLGALYGRVMQVLKRKPAPRQTPYTAIWMSGIARAERHNEDTLRVVTSV